MAPARSVLPTPVAKVPSAPALQVCESPDTSVCPGFIRPVFSSTTWAMPPRPTSIEVLDALVLDPALELLVHLGGLDVHGRHRVIRHRHDLVGIEDPVHAALFEHPQGGGGGDLVAQHPVGLALDQLPRCQRVVAAVGRQNLLGNRHSHSACSLLPGRAPKAPEPRGIRGPTCEREGLRSPPPAKKKCANKDVSSLVGGQHRRQFSPLGAGGQG